jgi:UDP-N-acetylglucosamine:LPS N-acetylglucosamine transferase
MKLALVCCSGGHLTEMELLLPALEGHERFFVTYRSFRTKAMTERERLYLIPFIGMNPLQMLAAFLRAFLILLRERPDVVLSTGAEIAVPFCWVGKLLGARVVYIESWCRVRSHSGSGPLVYPVADLFLVQWPDVVRCYGPKARYEGGLV